jgi:hypothetical protein
MFPGEASSSTLILDEASRGKSSIQGDGGIQELSKHTSTAGAAGSASLQRKASIVRVAQGSNGSTYPHTTTDDDDVRSRIIR